MSTRSSKQRSHLPLRLWPGVAIVAAQWIARFGLLLVWPDGSIFAIIGGIFGFAGIIMWWLLFSRAAWRRFDLNPRCHRAEPPAEAAVSQ